MSKSDDTGLHRLCHDGTVEDVKSFVEQLESVDALKDKLARKRGVFGYTPLHEAVAGGNHEVLDYLLTTTSSAHVNSRAKSGFTCLHVAASSGHISCLRVLLKNGADISIRDDYGKTPKQTAELSGKGLAVRILGSEGAFFILYVLQSIFRPYQIDFMFLYISCSDHTSHEENGLVNQVEILGPITGMW